MGLSRAGLPQPGGWSPREWTATMMGLEPQVPFILGTKVPKVGPSLGCEKFPKWELGRWSTPKVQGKAGPGPSSREARNPCATGLGPRGPGGPVF